MGLTHQHVLSYNPDFTRKLDSAIKQINKKTNLDVSYQRVNKRGSRKIAVLRFTIKNKYKSEK